MAASRLVAFLLLTPNGIGCLAIREAAAPRSSSAPLLLLRGGAFSNPLASLGARYAGALAAAPLATNIATAGTLSIVADGIAQAVAEARSSSESTSWDVSRSCWIVLWGTCISGFLMSRWFAFLAWLYPTARTSLAAFVLKLLTNQLFLSPGLNGGFFAFVIWTRQPPVARMTREKRKRLAAKLRADLLPTCLRSTLYWSCVQTLNFRVLPDHLGVVSTNVFFLFWTVYLCLIGNRSSAKDGST